MDNKSLKSAGGSGGKKEERRKKENTGETIHTHAISQTEQNGRVNRLNF